MEVPGSVDGVLLGIADSLGSAGSPERFFSDNYEKAKERAIVGKLDELEDYSQSLMGVYILIGGACLAIALVARLLPGLFGNVVALAFTIIASASLTLAYSHAVLRVRRNALTGDCSLQYGFGLVPTLLVFLILCFGMVIAIE